MRKSNFQLKNFIKAIQFRLASVVVVGVTKDEMLPRLQFLNKWEGSDVVINKNLPIEEIEGKSIYLVHKPGPQSIIILAHKGLKYDVDGDYFKAGVMNFLL